MTDRARARRGRAVFYHPTAAEALTQPGDWVGVITDVNTDGTVDLLVDFPNAATFAAALVPNAVADIAAFTDPPSAAEMALLRTFVNTLKANANLSVTLVNQLRTAAGRKASVTRGTSPGQYEFAPIDN